MRRFIPIVLLILVPLLVFVPGTPSPHDQGRGLLQTSDRGGPSGLWHSLQGAITAVRDALYLLAELTLDLFTGAWQAMPVRLRVLFGILLAGIGLLSSIGVVSLAAAGGFSRRFLG
jgi:hypothetical protein